LGVIGDDKRNTFGERKHTRREKGRGREKKDGWALDEIAASKP